MRSSSLLLDEEGSSLLLDVEGSSMLLDEEVSSLLLDEEGSSLLLEEESSSLLLLDESSMGVRYPMSDGASKYSVDSPFAAAFHRARFSNSARSDDNQPFPTQPGGV